MTDVHAQHDDHGNSRAAWTGVGILLVASALICLGIVLAVSTLWIVGIVGVVVGVLAWMIMGRSEKNTRAGDPRGTTAVH